MNRATYLRILGITARVLAPIFFLAFALVSLMILGVNNHPLFITHPADLGDPKYAFADKLHEVAIGLAAITCWAIGLVVGIGLWILGTWMMHVNKPVTSIDDVIREWSAVEREG